MIISKKELIEAANNVSENLTKYLKSTAKATADLISDKLQIEREKQAQIQQKIINEQKMTEINNIMLRLQYELWGVFSHITPPPRLTKIEYVADFQPAGWKITPDGVLYAFRWNKSNTEPFHRAYRQIILTKLNTAILAKHQHLLNEHQMLPYPECDYFCQEYQLILEGFQIEYILDNPVDLVLVVRIW